MMIISIKDLSNKFKKFADSFEGTNYQMWIEARSFCIEDNKNDFSIKDLKNIFYDKPSVEGDVIKINWTSALLEINSDLEYTSDDMGIRVVGKILNIATLDLKEKRSKEFWDIVKQYVDIPPGKTFIHKPGPGSYLCDYMMWGFSYIFVSNQRGLFVHAGSSD